MIRKNMYMIIINIRLKRNYLSNIFDNVAALFFISSVNTHCNSVRMKMANYGCRLENKCKTHVCYGYKAKAWHNEP